MSAELSLSAYERCCLCPRLCNADRRDSKCGVCGQTSRLIVGRVGLHFYEEPCISGDTGSGTVFFGGCQLSCRFCQNHELSRGNAGVPMTERSLADAFLRLQADSAVNINLVSGTQFLPHIVGALSDAASRGLIIPVVLNSGGYELTDTIDALKDIVDVYLPDMKYMDPDLSGRYSGARDYPSRAMTAIEAMVKQAGPPRFDSNGIMTGGVLVRHLVLPGCGWDSKAVLRRLWRSFGDDIYISIMRQYTPLPGLEPPLDRTVTSEEYDSIVDFAAELGISNAFIQTGDAVGTEYVPQWDYPLD